MEFVNEVSAPRFQGMDFHLIIKGQLFLCLYSYHNKLWYIKGAVAHQWTALSLNTNTYNNIRF